MALTWIDVGAVENEIEIAVEAVKEHPVTAVLIIDEFIRVPPRAVDASTVADGQGLYIPVLRTCVEARPKHIQLAVLALTEEWTVGDVVA